MTNPLLTAAIEYAAHGCRVALPARDDQFVHIDDAGEHHHLCRLNHRAELVHQSLVEAAAGGKRGR